MLYINYIFFISIIEFCFFFHLEPICDEPNEVKSSCDSRSFPCLQPCGPGRCKVACRKGCSCMDGFVRDRQTSQCVSKSTCFKCDPNTEVYSSCGSPCPPVCNREPIFCRARCFERCVCKDGYIRNRARKCIPKEQCCPKGQEYRCEFIDCPPGKMCILGCVWGCHPIMTTPATSKIN